MIVKDIIKIITTLFLLFTSFSTFSQGVIGAGLAFHPIAEETGLNVRFGGMSSKGGFTMEYTHFFVEEGVKLFQIGLSLNYRWVISENLKGRAIGGVTFLKYDSIIFNSSRPFSTDSNDELFGGHLGIGLDYIIGKNVSLFGEIRYLFHKELEDNALFNKATGSYFQPMAGFTFHF